MASAGKRFWRISVELPEHCLFTGGARFNTVRVISILLNVFTGIYCA